MPLTLLTVNILYWRVTRVRKKLKRKRTCNSFNLWSYVDAVCRAKIQVKKKKDLLDHSITSCGMILWKILMPTSHILHKLLPYATPYYGLMVCLQNCSCGWCYTEASSTHSCKHWPSPKIWCIFGTSPAMLILLGKLTYTFRGIIELMTAAEPWPGKVIIPGCLFTQTRFEIFIDHSVSLISFKRQCAWPSV